MSKTLSAQELANKFNLKPKYIEAFLPSWREANPNGYDSVSDHGRGPRFLYKLDAITPRMTELQRLTRDPEARKEKARLATRARWDEPRHIEAEGKHWSHPRFWEERSGLTINTWYNFCEECEHLPGKRGAKTFPRKNDFGRVTNYILDDDGFAIIDARASLPADPGDVNYMLLADAARQCGLTKGALLARRPRIIKRPGKNKKGEARLRVLVHREDVATIKEEREAKPLRDRLTITQAARYLGVPRSMVAKWCRKRSSPHIVGDLDVKQERYRNGKPVSEGYTLAFSQLREIKRAMNEDWYVDSPEGRLYALSTLAIRFHVGVSTLNGLQWRGKLPTVTAKCPKIVCTRGEVKVALPSTVKEVLERERQRWSHSSPSNTETLPATEPDNERPSEGATPPQMGRPNEVETALVYKACFEAKKKSKLELALLTVQKYFPRPRYPAPKTTAALSQYATRYGDKKAKYDTAIKRASNEERQQLQEIMGGSQK